MRSETEHSQAQGDELSRVYTLKPDYRHEALVPPDDPEIVDLFQRFNGTPFGEAWVPLDVEVDDDEELHDLPLGDLTLLACHIPVFSKRAVSCLEDILKGHGEILPLLSERGEYFAYNVTAIVDALDVSASEIDYLSTGRLANIRRYSLHRDKIGDAMIFKLPQVTWLDVFVTDRFVKRVEECELFGFEFKPV